MMGALQMEEQCRLNTQRLGPYPGKQQATAEQDLCQDLGLSAALVKDRVLKRLARECSLSLAEVRRRMEQEVRGGEA